MKCFKALIHMNPCTRRELLELKGPFVRNVDTKGVGEREQFGFLCVRLYAVKFKHGTGHLT